MYLKSTIYAVFSEGLGVALFKHQKIPFLSFPDRRMRGSQLVFCYSCSRRAVELSVCTSFPLSFFGSSESPAENLGRLTLSFMEYEQFNREVREFSEAVFVVTNHPTKQKISQKSHPNHIKTILIYPLCHVVATVCYADRI